MIPPSALPSSARHQSTLKPLISRAFLFFCLAIRGSVPYVEARFFEGMADGTIRSRFHGCGRYHVMLLSMCMVSISLKLLNLKEIVHLFEAVFEHGIGV
jgi:predicted PP-loop superfamily ATPase